MWHHKIPIRICAVLTFLLAANAAQLPSYASSSPQHYYYYPTPRNQLTFPRSVTASTQRRYQQQYASYAQTQQHYVQQQTRHQYQQQYRAPAAQSATSFYQHTQQLPASAAANVARRFTAPALEKAAFTTALTNQGYTFGGGGGGGDSSSKATSSISAARALPSSTLPLPSSLVEALAAGNDLAPEGAIDTSDASINLKLPLPVNVAPIKASPLPLQAGPSFSELANGVTSYGTVYPQRKRR